jgi:hypothetical protein
MGKRIINIGLLSPVDTKLEGEIYLDIFKEVKKRHGFYVIKKYVSSYCFVLKKLFSLII